MINPPDKNPKNKLDKISVHLEYACFICGIILSSSKTCINHVEAIHRYLIPFRPAGRRPENSNFSYVRDPNGPWTIEEYACPSCWYHSPSDDLEALNEHIREEHNPTRIMKEEEYEEEDVEMDESDYVQEITTKLDELKSIFEEVFS
ncbi:hypothetical protein BDF21DRAFT_498283 [Thamnidium elegans]|uniref:C2H2-type domain-containing protein n=1 Tax=Thamnidium elegans TaxID=101142 RepID=A0A8H7SHC0_9FUNG|nr:hypothetical protein INT48_004769 [Thamnidium elegans]KAI8051756.1 hypothetical protein BDF21DRAFT_498283 [Thamnidium elegans]